MSRTPMNHSKYSNAGFASSLDYYSTFPTYDPNSQIARLENKMTQHEIGYTSENKALQERLKEQSIWEANYKKELHDRSEELIALTHNYKIISNENEFNKNKVNETHIKLQELTGVYNNIQEEYTKLHKHHQLQLAEIADWKDKINVVQYDKQEWENEITTWTQLLNNYKSNLDENEMRLCSLNKEKDSYIKTIQGMKSQQSEYNNEQRKLEVINHKWDSEIKRLSEEAYVSEQQVDALKTENRHLLNEKEATEESNEKWQATVDKQRARITELEKENENISERKALTDKREMNFNCEIIKLKSENETFVQFVNDSLASISHWIDNYLPITYSSNVQIPEIPGIAPGVNDLSSKINFTILTKSLITAKANIDSVNSKDKGELKELRTNWMKCQEKNCKLNKDLEDINTYISNEMDIGGFWIDRNSKHSKVFSLGEQNYKASIDDWPSKVFALLKRAKIMSNENEVNDVIEDNNKLGDILEKVKYELSSCEKRNQMLMNEIDLKKACIKSLNEIIKRREYLEEDNKKLWKDNLILINKIKVWGSK